MTVDTSPEMSPERFRALTEAYGATPDHWPSHERDAAQALLDRGEPRALAALAQAQAIDAMLASHAVDAPQPELVKRVLGHAPPGRERRRMRLWLSGAGFAGVGAAGLLAGALAVSLLASGLSSGLTSGFATLHPESQSAGTEASYSNTAFGGGAGDWSGDWSDDGSDK